MFIIFLLAIFLHTDENVIFTSEPIVSTSTSNTPILKWSIVSINNQPFDPKHMYKVAINGQILQGMDKVEPLIKYIQDIQLNISNLQIEQQLEMKEALKQYFIYCKQENKSVNYQMNTIHTLNILETHQISSSETTTTTTSSLMIHHQSEL